MNRSTLEPRLAQALFGGILLAACAAPPDATKDSAPSAGKAPEARSASSAAAARSGPKPQLVEVPADITSGREYVKEQITRAESEGLTLVLYVGASWCEPCQRFHDAVLAGSLDAQLAGVRFLVFDHDAHEAVLGASDLRCRSRLIPLFARPNDDGTCGAQLVEGGIKGAGAVDFIMPKLAKIL